MSYKKIKIKLSEDYHICEGHRCFDRATEKHHIFSDTKINRSLYGKSIDHDNNIMLVCYDCHHNKPLQKFSEVEFCEAVGVKPMGKTLRFKRFDFGRVG